MSNLTYIRENVKIQEFYLNINLKQNKIHLDKYKH